MRNHAGSSSDEDECTGAEENAHEQLSSLFARGEWFSRPQREQHLLVLQILKEFPRLRSTRFRVWYGAENRTLKSTPLRLLVEGQAALDIVEACYQLDPTVLSQDFELIYILRRACEYRAPAEVVEYLGRKFPKPLNDSCYQQIALAFALKDTGRGRSSMETIQVLLKLCPKAVHYVNKEGDNALNLAIINGYDLEVVKLLLDVMREQSCDLDNVSIPARWNLMLDATAARSIDLVLSRQWQDSNLLLFQAFECYPAEWTEAGFSLVMQSLQNNKAAMKSIKIDLPSEESGIPDVVVKYAFCEIIKDESNVEELELVAQNASARIVHAALQGINRGLCQSHRLQKLVIQGAQQLSLNLLSSFLASSDSPSAVHITGCHIFGGAEQQIPSYMDEEQTESIIGCIELKNSFFDHSTTFRHFMNSLSNLPKLTELYLIAPSDFSTTDSRADFAIPTEALVALLNKNTLQSLGIAAYTFDVTTFYDCFHTNTSLQQYRYTNKKGFGPDRLKAHFERHKQQLVRVMDAGNVTLMDAYIGNRIHLKCSNNNTKNQQNTKLRDEIERDPTGAKIEHFALLNQYGRYKARNPTASLASVVNLLCDVKDPYTAQCLDSWRKHNLQYGLLLESLSIWSTISSNKASP